MAHADGTHLVPADPLSKDRFTYRAQRTYIYKHTPQTDLSIQIHYPFDWQPDQRRPAVVFFFGGGWRSGTLHQFERQATYLASRGMVAARADYRVKARHDVSPDICVQDAKSAVRWMRLNAATLGIDPHQLVASGGSAGGHIAACAGIVPGLDAAGEDLSISAVPNALLLFNPVLRTHDWERVANMIPAEIGRQISPILHLSAKAPPMLIMFGTKDDLDQPVQSFMARCQELACHAELYLAEGERHGFFNQSPWMERTLYRSDEFLAKLGYLQGKPTFVSP